MLSRPLLSRPDALAPRALRAVAVLLAAASLGCATSGPDEQAAEAAPAVAAAGDAAQATAEDVEPDLAWDPERMTQLTAELSKAVSAVRDSFRNDPLMNTPDSSKRRSALQMNDLLRNLDRQCRSLAAQVKSGKGRADTSGTARRIGTLLRDANELGRGLVTSEWTDQRIRPAMELVNQIAPYYGRGPMYDMETMTMIGQGPNPNRRRQGE